MIERGIDSRRKSYGTRREESIDQLGKYMGKIPISTLPQMWITSNLLDKLISKLSYDND